MNDLQKELVLSLRKYFETSIELESIAMICFLLRKLPQKRDMVSFSPVQNQGYRSKVIRFLKRGD